MVLLIITIVLVWLAQRGLAVRQAMRFRRQYSALRRDGRLVAVGAAKRIGRRVFVALADAGDGTVAESMVFSGVTIFAQGRGDSRLTGLSIARLADGVAPPGVEPLVAQAATQAAGFLITAAGKRATASGCAARPSDKRKVRTSSRG